MNEPEVDYCYHRHKANNFIAFHNYKAITVHSFRPHTQSDSQKKATPILKVADLLEKLQHNALSKIVLVTLALKLCFDKPAV